VIFIIDDGQIPHPQTINIGMIEYIDRVVNHLKSIIESKCEKWDLGLNKLRTEWKLEHTNLIQRFESFLLQYENNNIEIEKHFERINELQNRMDKLSNTFVTKETFDEKMKSANMFRDSLQIIMWSLIIGAFIAHIFGKL
jgi:hypothetical protein